MSATNRGRKRNDSDFYKTPGYAIEVFLRNYRLESDGLTILDPCAGSGTIAKAVKKFYPKAIINQCEIREDQPLIRYEGGWNFRGNALDLNSVDIVDVGVIISNPPYSMAQEIIEHFFKIKRPTAQVIMLLRIGFLESQKRIPFWKKYPVSELYPLSHRPSFTGDGHTDATAYAWFVWNNSDRQVIKVIS